MAWRAVRRVCLRFRVSWVSRFRAAARVAAAGPSGSARAASRAARRAFGKGADTIHGGHDASGDIRIGGEGHDVIFGDDGNDDLQGDAGDDTFIMRAGFGRDDVNGGDGYDTITLNSVLTSADLSDPNDLSAWLTLDDPAMKYDATVAGEISFIDASGDTISASGTIDLGGGDVITFENIAQIDYALVG